MTGNTVSLEQLNTIIKEILAPALDEDHADAAPVTLYSFRRVLPTLADIMQMLWEKCMHLGGWKTKGEQGKERSTMPMRYADRKDITEQAVKATAVKVLAAAVKVAESPTTWETVRAALPNVDTTAIEMQSGRVSRQHAGASLRREPAQAERWEGASCSRRSSTTSCTTRRGRLQTL